MFYDNSNGKFDPRNGLSARALQAGNTAGQAAQTAAQSAAVAAQLAAQSAAQNVGSTAQSTAQNVGSASRTAAQGMGRSVRQGVYTTRGWVAPRLESAADYAASRLESAGDYTTKSMAPRVSGALRTTARQVSPEDANGGRSVLQVILLSIAALAGVGAIAAVIQRQRAKSAGRKESEGDLINAGDADEPTVSVPGQTTSRANQAEVPVNGQASSSRR